MAAEAADHVGDVTDIVGGSPGGLSLSSVTLSREGLFLVTNMHMVNIPQRKPTQNPPISNQIIIPSHPPIATFRAHSKSFQ